MKLYALAGACSMVPHTALEWAKIDYQLELVDHATIKSEAYLQINPQGQVPLLVEGDFILTQNTAIVHYIDTLYPQAQIFGGGNQQQKALAKQWLAYFNADVHPTFGALFYPQKYVTNEQAIEELKQSAVQKIHLAFTRANTALLDKPFITGHQITIADVYLYVLLRWATSLKLDLAAHTKLPDFISQVENNAGVQAVLIQENQSFLKSK